MAEVRLDDLILDKHMIELMLVHAIRVPSVFTLVNAELQPTHFDETELIYRTIYIAAKQYYEQYHELPGKEALAVITLAHLAAGPTEQIAEQMEAQSIIDWMWSAYSAPEHFATELAMTIVRKFLRERVVNARISELSRQVSANAIPSVIPELISVQQTAQRIESMGFSSHNTLVPMDFNRAENEKIPTNMPVFDQFLDGGNYRGEVNALLAPTGVGKTMSAIDIICHRAAANAEKELTRPGSGQLCFYISFEEGDELIMPRFWARAARIEKPRAEAARSFNDFTSSARNDLLPYEQQIYQSVAGVYGGAIPGEYERLMVAKSWMDQFIRFGDFSGGRGRSGTGVVRGHGGLPEIAAFIESEVQASGRGVDSIAIDWAGSCVRRYLRKVKGGDAKNLLSVELMDFIDQVHSQLTARYNCVGWVMHQLAGAVNDKPSTFKFHHSQAEWCSSFAVNAWFAFVLGTKDIATSTAVLRCTKARRVEAKLPIVCHINGLFGRLDPSTLVIDSVSGRIATRQETARFEETDHRPRDTGMDTVLL